MRSGRAEVGAEDEEPYRLNAVFTADSQVGPRPRRSGLGGDSTRLTRPMASEPADGGEHSAVVAVSDVDGMGARAHLLLQRRLPPRHSGPQVPVGAGTARQSGVGGDLGRHRPADRAGACRPSKRPGTRRCCCSSSAPDMPRRRYHTFSYSPLRDDDGHVVGMLCVVSEDTQRVISERRMATLRDLGSDPSVIRTEAEMLVVRRPPAQPESARPAVHIDLPVRRRRRTPAWRVRAESRRAIPRLPRCSQPTAMRCGRSTNRRRGETVFGRSRPTPAFANLPDR